MKPIRNPKVALLTAGLVVALFSGCATQKDFLQITPEPFGKTLDGTPVQIYTLRNAVGTTARIMTYGGIVQSLDVPDKQGNFGDVVLGYDTLDGYLTNSPYFGALIGRYGNRIAKGHFTLDGHEYKLAINNGPNDLHGGTKGFEAPANIRAEATDTISAYDFARRTAPAAKISTAFGCATIAGKSCRFQQSCTSRRNAPCSA